jgi:hypothetical protein
MNRSRKKINPIKRQVKIWMAENQIESLAELARLIDVRREELSMCLHQHQYRTYPVIRRKLSLKMGISYERLWGSPATRNRSNAAINRMQKAA